LHSFWKLVCGSVKDDRPTINMNNAYIYRTKANKSCEPPSGGRCAVHTLRLDFFDGVAGQNRLGTRLRQIRRDGIFESSEVSGSIFRPVSRSHHQIWQNQSASAGKPPAIPCQNTALAPHNQPFPRTPAIYPNTMLTEIRLFLENWH